MTRQQADIRQVLAAYRSALNGSSDDEKLIQAVAALNEPVTLRVGDGPWLFEGFIQFLLRLRDLVAAVDPSVPPGLPPHLLNPKVIAKWLGISPDEMNVQNVSAFNLLLEERLDRIEANLPKVGSGSTDPILNDYEESILTAIGNDTLKGEEVARRLKYTFHSHFKGTLASLVRRGLLAKDNGYYRPGGQGQDHCQD